MMQLKEPRPDPMTPKQLAARWYADVIDDPELIELRIAGLARLINRYFTARVTPLSDEPTD